MSDKRAWMVRAGNDNELVEEFKENDLVAIGWDGIGNLSDATTREAVKDKYRQAFPNHSKYRVGVNAGQIYRFSHKFGQGDIVLTYDKTAREYHIGRIDSGYVWKPDEAPADYPHVRFVEWENTISRDEFSTPAKNTLGSSLTVFSLDDLIGRINQILQGGEIEDVEGEEEEETPPYVEEVQSKSEELISDRIAKMDPFDFEELVAAVLRAMGYKAAVTEAGPDQGIDIVAHPDALGFESPLIKVQVKHRKSTAGGPDMREFIGTLGQDEKGLYVSTGGYTRDARNEARGARTRVTLLDRDEFIELLLQHYENLESEYKAEVPLKKVYIPKSE